MTSPTLQLAPLRRLVVLIHSAVELLPRPVLIHSEAELQLVLIHSEEEAHLQPAVLTRSVMIHSEVNPAITGPIVPK